MKVHVYLLASGQYHLLEGVRVVDIPDSEVVDLIYHWPCRINTLLNVVVSHYSREVYPLPLNQNSLLGPGDVIKLPGNRNFLLTPSGFLEIGKQRFLEYGTAFREDRVRLREAYWAKGDAT